MKERYQKKLKPPCGGLAPLHRSSGAVDTSKLGGDALKVKHHRSVVVGYHCHSVSLHMFWYNFIRSHQTIRCTPAMAAGVTDQLWEMSDLVALIESRECEAAESCNA